MKFVVAVLGIAILMIVHEAGHYFVARRFGMRVLKFSIGFGPTLYKHRPRGSDTVFQIAVIPFMAYVQIAGMNPFDEEEAHGPGSYANASLFGRVATIAAGPIANYVFASVLLFCAFALGGKTHDQHSMKVQVSPDGRAAAADMRDGDKILAVEGKPTPDWPSLIASIKGHPGEPLAVTIERDGQPQTLTVTPGDKGTETEGKISIGPEARPVRDLGEAVSLSLTEPPRVVYELVAALGRVIMLKEKPELSGPVGIVKETARAAESGAPELLMLLGMLSAYLGGFNLLPVPALDGGRLIFLVFEALARRKADAKVEAGVHAVGLLMMLTLVAAVTWTELFPKH
jgi:regulator of sigma E protease